MNNYDFVAIGDIVTDAFIKLKEAHVNCDINKENCQICMRFGDKIPYQEVFVLPAVGNSPNAAVAAARLGLNSALVTNLGADSEGQAAQQALTDNKVATEFVTVHHHIKTNYHYVLWYEDERTILVKHEEYPYAWPNIAAPKWLYLSSLGGNSLEYHDAITNYLEQNPSVKLAFQPGTFQMKAGAERLQKLYQHTEIFFCNKEEAKRILAITENTEIEIKELLNKIRTLGPKIAVITDGPKGAYASDGTQTWFMPPYPDLKPPYERTGAGDAFSSTVTAALALGKTLPEALTWGPINSMSVVQKVGAQEGLLDRASLEKYLAEAPASYKPQTI
jgi:ribokinase